MRLDRLTNRTRNAELELLRDALAGAGDIAFVWDLRHDTIAWAGRVAEVFGVAGAHRLSTGAAFLDRIHPDDLIARKRALSEHVASGRLFDCEYRVRADGGDLVWLHERGSVTFDAKGNPERVAGTMRIVTARKENEARLEFRAHYDELTGHLNASRLRESLEQAMAYAERYAIDGAFLLIGVDTIAMIHDAFDGPTADAAVLALGKRIDRNVRSSDIVGRLSGDTFGVVLTNCAPANLGSIALKLISGIQQEPVNTGSGPLHLKVSMGAATFPREGVTAHDIIAQADIARREAIETPALPFVRYQYTEAKRRDSRQNVAIAERVMRGLKEGQLVFAYQPIVSARDRKTLYHECLLRLVEEDGSVVAAGQFMPVIERLGLIREVDRYVLETAVRQLEEHTQARFAVNVSALTVCDRAWLRLLFALLRNAPDAAERLIIEITETVALQDNDETADFVAQVRDLGCRVALDDFGAGYTSFRHLKSLAVDSVKIDGAYVRGVAANIDNQLFVRTLLGLAKGFDLTTIAECVETEEDAAALTAHGVDCLQGYYFGKPSVVPPWQEPRCTAKSPKRRSGRPVRREAG